MGDWVKCGNCGWEIYPEEDYGTMCGADRLLVVAKVVRLWVARLRRQAVAWVAISHINPSRTNWKLSAPSPWNASPTSSELDNNSGSANPGNNPYAAQIPQPYDCSQLAGRTSQIYEMPTLKPSA